MWQVNTGDPVHTFAFGDAQGQQPSGADTAQPHTTAYWHTSKSAQARDSTANDKIKWITVSHDDAYMVYCGERSDKNKDKNVHKHTPSRQRPQSQSIRGMQGQGGQVKCVPSACSSFPLFLLLEVSDHAHTLFPFGVHPLSNLTLNAEPATYTCTRANCN